MRKIWNKIINFYNSKKDENESGSNSDTIDEKTTEDLIDENRIVKQKTDIFVLIETAGTTDQIEFVKEEIEKINKHLSKI